MYNSKGITFTCPKTGEVKILTTDNPSPEVATIPATKADLPCGRDCNIEPCPGIERHNLIP